jgi:hypothetical protein
MKLQFIQNASCFDWGKSFIKRCFDMSIQIILNYFNFRLFVTLYAKSTDKMPRQHTSNPKIPKVSKAIASPFY